jgi:hemoglobin
MAKDRLIDRIGGAALREVIDDFYRRLFADVMIGFLFQGKDRASLADKEWQFTARLLGDDVAYTGRSIPDAHRRSPILGGHFERRLQILRDTLRDHAVDAEVQRVWIEHTLALRDQVTKLRGSDCDHALAPPPPLGDETIAPAEGTNAPPPQSAGLVTLKRR